MEKDIKYRTLSGVTEGLYKEKGSKFIAYAAPCYSEEEAKQLLEKWRRDHHKARHLCYAYRLGHTKEVYRANDDGEPSNSAGAPILGQIQSYELTNVLIGVVRYFGGTKLGVGGLINAYRSAAKDAIEHGKIVERKVQQWLELEFAYSDMNDVMKFLKDENLEPIEKIFEDSCKLLITVPINRAKDIRSQLLQLDTLNLNDKGVK